MNLSNSNITARKRAVYDQFGEEGLKNGVPVGSGESGAWTQGYTFHGDAHKVFREFFGGDNPFRGEFSFRHNLIHKNYATCVSAEFTSYLFYKKFDFLCSTYILRN